MPLYRECKKTMAKKNNPSVEFASGTPPDKAPKTCPVRQAGQASRKIAEDEFSE
jgi:hypothetical protein